MLKRRIFIKSVVGAGCTAVTGSIIRPLVAWSADTVLPINLPLSELDPNSAMNANYYKIAESLADAADIEAMVGKFWGMFRKDHKLSSANAAVLWNFLLWRATPLGEKRIRVAMLGRKMAQKMQEQFPDRVDGYSWDATFMGMEGLSRGVLQTLYMIPDFLAQLERSIKMDESYFYGMGLMLMAKMYLKLPVFPVSMGDPAKAHAYLNLARPYQEHSYAFFYNVLAEAQLIAGEEQKALATLDSFADTITATTKAEQFTLDLAIHDAAQFRKVIKDGTYDKYMFDPFLVPIEDFRGFVLAQRRS